ncbi:MAG: polysaccharide export protein [Candidatus Omnitrophica bacterium]|nr:polysaccharide export protein [Candidatus Omnitrophota bacterium]
MSGRKYQTIVALLPFFFSFFFNSSLLATENAPSFASNSSAFTSEYRIGANDVLEISVYGEEDLTQEVRVTDGGYVSYPLLGRIKVLGLSIVEVEDYLRKALAKDYIRDPQVRVFVKEFTNIYVLGQVKEPGPYPFKGGLTVLQAITMAGGFTKVSNQRKVRIVGVNQADRKVIHANVSSISKGDDPDVLLEPGDNVIVPESFF